MSGPSAAPWHRPCGRTSRRTGPVRPTCDARWTWQVPLDECQAWRLQTAATVSSCGYQPQSTRVAVHGRFIRRALAPSMRADKSADKSADRAGPPYLRCPLD
ncbi:MAG: hypothetical protein WCO57_06795, partial [Verrucomicrobiota bacterium]